MSRFQFFLVRKVFCILICGLLFVVAAAQSNASQGSLSSRLSVLLNQAGKDSGAVVIDVTTGRVLFDRRGSHAFVPASSGKVYSVAASLWKFGPTDRIPTNVYGTGELSGSTWNGDIYLQGNGDPAFSSQTFAQRYLKPFFDKPATTEQLAAQLKALGISSITGKIFADESVFDQQRDGPHPAGSEGLWYMPAPEGSGGPFGANGRLSALAFNMGIEQVSPKVKLQRTPALAAGKGFSEALQAAGIGFTNPTPDLKPLPAGAQLLTQVFSPPISQIAQIIDLESNSYSAELLTKRLGTTQQTPGTTANGMAVIRDVLSEHGIKPAKLIDGSGDSNANRSSPKTMANLLRTLWGESPPIKQAFFNSLAIAGKTGTLAERMRKTPAQGRCRGKTGTHPDPGEYALIGYCKSRKGRMVAFAFLINHARKDRSPKAMDEMTQRSRDIQDKFAVELAR